MENITAMKMNELDLKCINIGNLKYELLSENKQGVSQDHKEWHFYLSSRT